jgi:hypothetical protein
MSCIKAAVIASLSFPMLREGKYGNVESTAMSISGLQMDSHIIAFVSLTMFLAIFKWLSLPLVTMSQFIFTHSLHLNIPPQNLLLYPELIYMKVPL